MNVSGKRTKKFRDIARFLKGNGHFLVLALAAGMLTTIFNALTPQIIRYTVDHLTGEGANNGGFFENILGTLLGNDIKGNFLLFAAIAVLVSASCAGIFT